MLRMICVLLILLAAPTLTTGEAVEAKFRLATFAVDVTIPPGHRCMGILPTKAQHIDDPLEARGIILLGPEQPVVLVAVDWCEIRNGAYDQWRDTLAEATGSTRERVLVCALHQHDAPVVDREAQLLLDTVGMEQELYDREFHARCLEQLGQAARQSLALAQPVTHIATGQTKVEGIASSRRVVLQDGSISWNRYSASGGDAFHRSAPDGPIDPMLKTITFFHGDTPLVMLHAYATHPMSYYGRGGVSADFVGLARRRMQQAHPQVFQIYVSGCSGDVTAGKYNDGSERARAQLADRLYRAMEAGASAASTPRPFDSLQSRNTTFDLPFHEGESFRWEALQSTLRDDGAKESERILAAMSLSSLQRKQRGQPIDMPCLDLGAAQIVLFPGETFVGYQRMAQQLRPDSFVMCIGYGECWPGYVPTEAAFADNFNHDWRWVGRGSERILYEAMQRVLR